MNRALTDAAAPPPRARRRSRCRYEQERRRAIDEAEQELDEEGIK
jgi:hypothetical protein